MRVQAQDLLARIAAASKRKSQRQRVPQEVGHAAPGAGRAMQRAGT
jgi:hypothetical protein